MFRKVIVFVLFEIKKKGKERRARVVSPDSVRPSGQVGSGRVRGREIVTHIL